MILNFEDNSKDMTPQRIRPIAICVFRHQDRILVFEAYDPVDDKTFYRPLGGGILFGEYSVIAIQREIKEEIGAKIRNLSFLGCLENIFTHEGKSKHEIVQVYDAEFVDPEFYQRESLEGFEDNGYKLKVMWMNIEIFKNGKVPLYPNGLLDLLMAKI